MQYISDAGVGGKVERSIPEVYVSDGHWHSFSIEKNGTSTVLAVDQIHSREILHVTQDFGGLNVVTVSLGGIPPNQALKSSDPGMLFTLMVKIKWLSIQMTYVVVQAPRKVKKPHSCIKFCRG